MRVLRESDVICLRENVCVVGYDGKRIPCMFRLKSVGERTDPCLTLFVKRFVVNGLPLYTKAGANKEADVNTEAKVNTEANIKTETDVNTEPEVKTEADTNTKDDIDAQSVQARRSSRLEVFAQLSLNLSFQSVINI